MKQFKIYSTLLLIAVLFSFNSCSSEPASPGDAIAKTYDLIKIKKFKKVAAMYVSRDGIKLSDEESKKLEGLAGMAYTEFEKNDGIKNVEIIEDNINEDGKTSKVKFKVHFNNGDTKNEKANLIEIDGDWFIKL